MARYGDLNEEQAKALGAVIASRIELRIALEGMIEYPGLTPSKSDLSAMRHAVERIDRLEAALKSGQ